MPFCDVIGSGSGRGIELLDTRMATQQSSSSESGELVILHATDIHIASHKVYQLKEWLRVNKQRVDVVLLSGDIADMPLELYYTASQEEIESQHKLLDKVVEEFLPLAPAVYYIPGNHDAITTFKTEGLSSEGSPCNVHMRQVCVAPNLHLFGIGGSIPGYKDGKHLWDGFPYRNEEEYAKDLIKLLDDGFLSGRSCLKPQDAVILMTHSGPDKSSTTVSHIDPLSPIYSGSPTLYNYLCKEQLQQHVVMNIHGHTHDGSGQATIGKFPVINPGPLMAGHFGIYTLRSSTKLPTWELASTCLYRLPS